MSLKKEITSLENPLVKHLVKLRKDKNYRYDSKTIFVEGIKPIQELAAYVKKVFYTQNPFVAALEEYQVTEAVMKKISGMTSPEGLVAEVNMPALSLLKDARWILVLDGVNDPGNMGTLLRTALALGWEGVYILPSSCDPYNEKTVRAGRGAQWRLPIALGTINDFKNFAEKKQLIPLVADLDGQSPDKLNKEKGCILVLGNEARGASPGIMECSSKVSIPMPGEMESLNVSVAGGILMYLMRKL